MPKSSAGLLLYRRHDRRLEVLLVHPGGPFWSKKDAGAWSIPKGEVQPQEDVLAAAVREVREETGFTVEGPFTDLRPVRQSGKIVHAWAAPYDADPATIESNTFSLEYPPRSGQMRDFPEIDRGEWFDRASAAQKILKSQRPLIDEFFERFGK